MPHSIKDKPVAKLVQFGELPSNLDIGRTLSYNRGMVKILREVK